MMEIGLQYATLAWFGMLASSFTSLQAQTPVQIVQQAVNAELEASRSDHSHWRFRQEEKVPLDTVSIIVQTAQGSVKEKIEQDGHPLSSEAAAAEQKRVQAFIHDSILQQKQRRDSSHDDANAAKLLEMLPTAFTWTIASENPESIILHFQPNPSFQPPDMESRVMSAMAGELIVDRNQHRIHTMRGTLSHEVQIGYGLLGKLRQGGTFDVERREIAPHLWQIVETHVHIDGHALIFKTIGEQQDEIDSAFTRVPDTLTLPQAANLLVAPASPTLATGSIDFPHPRP